MTEALFRGEIYAGPDGQGRYHYALFWWTHHPGDKVAGIEPGEWFERAQHFHATLRSNVLYVDLRDRERHSGSRKVKS